MLQIEILISDVQRKKEMRPDQEVIAGRALVGRENVLAFHGNSSR
jgi:hypothetical protein